MKRLLVALLVGGVMFGTVFAVAAALDVDAGTIQAGEDVDLACDPDGVDVFIGWDYSDDANAYVVTGVIVSDIDEACAGGFMSVTFTDGDGDKIETGGAEVNGTSETVNVTGTIKVADLEDIHVLIVTPSA